jgi:hypothetical protein
MAVMAAAGVLRIWAAVGGTGVVRVWCWPPGKRTCAVMVSRVRDDGDVGEQQPGDALALAGRGGGVVPDRGQVGDQLLDPGFLGVGELPGVVLAGVVVCGALPRVPDLAASMPTLLVLALPGRLGTAVVRGPVRGPFGPSARPSRFSGAKDQRQCHRFAEATSGHSRPGISRGFSSKDCDVLRGAGRSGKTIAITQGHQRTLDLSTVSAQIAESVLS